MKYEYNTIALNGKNEWVDCEIHHKTEFETGITIANHHRIIAMMNFTAAKKIRVKK